MILALSPERELDQILAGDVNPIVAEFVICDNTLCIQEHAVASYTQWLNRSTNALSRKRPCGIETTFSAISMISSPLRLLRRRKRSQGKHCVPLL